MKQESEHMPLHMIFGQIAHLSKYGAMRLLDEIDINPGQAGILFVLNKHGKLSQRELAEKTGVKPPSMTVALRKIEELGYVRKEPDEKDQRIIRIALTNEGRQYISQVKKVIGNIEKIMFQDISEEEQLLLRKLVLKMQENLCKSKEFKNADAKQMVNHPHCSIKEDI